MSAGDFKVMRNASNTDAIPSSGSDLLLLWDTAVSNKGSGITYSAGTFTLGEIGRFLVMCSDQYGTTDTTNNTRTNAKTTFTLAGTELITGYSTGFIRKSGGSQEFINFSSGIIEVTTTAGTGDELQIRSERADAYSPAINRIADRSGITIVKLDDSWDYGRYHSSANTTSSASDGAAVTMNIQTEDEEDLTFTRTTNTVDIATGNLVLAVYSLKCEDGTAGGRQEFQGRLTLGGTVVPGSYTQTYIRDYLDEEWGGMSNVCLLKPTSGDDLEVELVTREAGGTATFEASLQLVELPSTATAAIMEATGGDFNTSATNFTWDTLPYIDTDDFTATAGNANIDIDKDGDYLVFASQGCTAASTAARAVPALSFRVNTTDDETAGGSSFNRTSGTARYAAISTGTLLTGLSVSDSIYAHNDRIGTVSLSITNGSGAFSVLSLASLVPSPTITNAGDDDFTVYETNITVTGTLFGAIQGSGDLELGDSATYGSATLVSQSIDSWSDTSIQFDLTIGTLDVESLWLYVTDDSAAVSVAYAVNVNLTPSITNADDEEFDLTETNITLTGDDFLNVQGTGKLEIGNNSVYASATKVTQSIDSWANTSVQFDLALGALTEVDLWLFVTNDLGFVSTGYAVQILRNPIITNVEDEEINNNEQNVVLDGTYFQDTQATGKLELADNVVYASATKVTQSIDTWDDTEIVFDVIKGSFVSGTHYFYVTNDQGKVSTGYEITLIQPPPESLYKQGSLQLSITSAGLDTTVFLIRDE